MNRTTDKLKRHLIIILTFSCSSIVVLFLGAKDLQYLSAAIANDKVSLIQNDRETEIKPGDNREYSGATDNRAEKFNVRIQELNQYLTSESIANDYGIYFQDLNNEELLYTHNADRVFKPASIYKVPLAMVTLKNAERELFSLDEIATHMGKPKTLKNIIELMIQKSDNDAMGILEAKNGGYNATQQQITTELNGAQVKRIGQRTTAVDIANVLTTLYTNRINGEQYLTPEHREFLLSLMETAESQHRDRIPAAVAKFNSENETELTAATKIGNLLGVYQDAGIVFGGNGDYVLVILNQNKRTYLEATTEIEIITKLLLTELEGRHD